MSVNLMYFFVYILLSKCYLNNHFYILYLPYYNYYIIYNYVFQNLKHIIIINFGQHDAMTYSIIHAVIHLITSSNIS